MSQVQQPGAFNNITFPGALGAGPTTDLPPSSVLGSLWRPMQGDGVQSIIPQMLGAAQSAYNASSPQGTQGGIQGLFSALISGLGNIINSITASIGNMSGEQNAEGPASQFVNNATFSSTGDPHLAETGSTSDANGNAQSVNNHFDSMTAHDNLISSQDFSGGYRVSTAVTQPNANGVTLNQSATVHTNDNQNTVTMNNDGSFAITQNGQNISLSPGQSTTLSAGEQVTRNANGSLTVAEQNDGGGTISTTMQTNGSGGVDVTTNVQNASVGGDIAGQRASQAAANQPTAGGWRTLPPDGITPLPWAGGPHYVRESLPNLASD
jgi:hypothetical protein